MSETTKSSSAKLIIAFLVFVALIGGGWMVMTPTGYNNGYAPEQPIPYSHKLHAGTLKIPCMYCHVNVDKGRHASVPALSVCMNCHSQVRKISGAKEDSPHIKKLVEAYETGHPIQWVKVHMLPDFVFFNHQRHVKRGVACQTCHGDVQSMDRVEQVESLSMGWCVNCHRKPENNVSTTCTTCHQ